ncbi:MAG: hypothetical protein KDB00_29880 [Planctomycetales bacterium]|nr:hypothetical protein [Planctomycetales bacterium]
MPLNLRSILTVTALLLPVGNVCLYSQDDVPNLELINTLELDSDTTPTWSPSGKHLFVLNRIGNQDVCRLINVSNHEVTDLRFPERPTAITWNHDDTVAYIAVQQSPHIIQAYDAATGELIWKSAETVKEKLNNALIQELRVSPDRKILCGVSANRLIYAWDCNSGEAIGDVEGILAPFGISNQQICFLRGGTHLIGNSKGPGPTETCVFEIASGQQTAQFESPHGDHTKLSLVAPTQWRAVGEHPYAIARVTASVRPAGVTTSALAVWNTDTGKCERVLYQGSLDLAAAQNVQLDPSNRFAFFADPQSGIQVAPLAGKNRPFALSVEPGRQCLVADQAGLVAVLQPSQPDVNQDPERSTPSLTVSVMKIPDLSDAGQMQAVQQSIDAIDHLPDSDPTAKQENANQNEVQNEPSVENVAEKADAGAIEDDKDAGAIKIRPLQADNKLAQNPQAPARPMPVPRDAWQMGLGEIPFTAIGRIEDDSFSMCFDAAVPWLQLIEGKPQWDLSHATLGSKLSLAEIEVFRGDGQRVSIDDSVAMLKQDRFVFILPNGTADASWVNHLNPDAIVIGIHLRPSCAPGGLTCTPAACVPTCGVPGGQTIDVIRRLSCDCDDQHFMPHASVQLWRIATRKPELAAERSTQGFETKVETRTRTITVQKTRTETRTREVDGKTETYTIEVPVQEQIEQSYTVCVPVPTTFMISRFSNLKPSNLATQPEINRTLHQLRCYRANGQSLHPLVFLAYAMRIGSFLELPADAELHPEMLLTNLRPWSLVAQIVPSNRSAKAISEVEMRSQLDHFRQLLDDGNVDGARDTLFKLPISKPLWATEFYELALHQHRAGDEAEAKDTVLAGAILEWEQEIPNFNVAWNKNHEDDSAEWVKQMRLRCRAALQSQVESAADFGTPEPVTPPAVPAPPATIPDAPAPPVPMPDA